MNYFYVKRNGNSALCNYQGMNASRRLLSTKEAQEWNEVVANHFLKCLRTVIPSQLPFPSWNLHLDAYQHIIFSVKKTKHVIDIHARSIEQNLRRQVPIQPDLLMMSHKVVCKNGSKGVTHGNHIYLIIKHTFKLNISLCNGKGEKGFKGRWD